MSAVAELPFVPVFHGPPPEDPLPRLANHDERPIDFGRTVDVFVRRPPLQERLAANVANAMLLLSGSSFEVQGATAPNQEDMMKTSSSFTIAKKALFCAMIATVCALAPAVRAQAAMLAAGTTMPEFALTDQNGATVRSADLSGKTYLLWFYPKAMTPGCTTEARGLRDKYAALEAAGVVVFGVSFDEPADNRQFAEAEALPFRLLSDKDRQLAVALGAAGSTSAMFASRISYLVGPDGKIRKAYDNVDPSTHATQVLADQ